MTKRKTTAAAGARWKSAATAPSSAVSRRGGARREAACRRPARRAGARRLLAAGRDRPGPPLPDGAAGRLPARLDHRGPEPARISRRARPARGLSSRSRFPASTHFVDCRFRQPGRPLRSDEMIALAIDGRPLSGVSLNFLVRFWLATPEARDADPAPLGDVAALPRLPRSAAYALQQALDGLPLAAIYALLAAAYSLIYGLVGRINLAFGDFAAAGGYAAALGALLAAGQTPATILATALALGGAAAALWGIATSRWVFHPLRSATGQQALVASVGLAMAIERISAPGSGRPAGVGEPDAQRAVRSRALRRFRRHLRPRRSAFGRLRNSRRPDAGRGDAVHPLRPPLARLCRRPARRPAVRRQPARDPGPDLRAGRRVRRPLRLRDDDVLRLGRLRRRHRPRPQGAGRRHSRRRRLDPRRPGRRLPRRRLRGRLAGLFLDRLSRRRRIQPAGDHAGAEAWRPPRRPPLIRAPCPPHPR